MESRSVTTGREQERSETDHFDRYLARHGLVHFHAVLYVHSATFHREQQLDGQLPASFVHRHDDAIRSQRSNRAGKAFLSAVLGAVQRKAAARQVRQGVDVEHRPHLSHHAQSELGARLAFPLEEFGQLSIAQDHRAVGEVGKMVDGDKEAPRKDKKQGDEKQPHQENAASQFQGRVEVIQKNKSAVDGAQNLHQANEHLAPIAQYGGAVKIEIVHAQDQSRRDRKNFGSAMLRAEHLRGVTHAQASNRRGQESEGNQKRLRNPKH